MNHETQPNQALAGLPMHPRIHLLVAAQKHTHPPRLRGRIFLGFGLETEGLRVRSLTRGLEFWGFRALEGRVRCMGRPLQTRTPTSTS